MEKRLVERQAGHAALARKCTGEIVPPGGEDFCTYLCSTDVGGRPRCKTTAARCCSSLRWRVVCSVALAALDGQARVHSAGRELAMLCSCRCCWKQVRPGASQGKGTGSSAVVWTTVRICSV
jgi:hypothetical protein